MRVITLESFESGPSLREVLTTEIASNKALIRLHAASNNAIDITIVAGALRGMMDYRCPVIAGRGLTGVVEAIGAEVSPYAIGDEVFGGNSKNALYTEGEGEVGFREYPFSSVR